MLEKLEVDGKDLRLIRNLYWDQTAAIRIDGEVGEWKDKLVKKKPGWNQVLEKASSVRRSSVRKI